MNVQMIVKPITCKLCGYLWYPRIAAPKCCPACKRYDYAKPKAAK